MGRAEELHELGQSIWYDNIERSMLDDGSIAMMIEARQIYGITSNPSIFEKAIGSGKVYDFTIQTLASSGMDKEQIYTRLVIEDMQRACDLFRPLYDSSGGNDGFVSLEVSPLLAHDATSTISDARSLWAQVNRKNLMVKVPATLEGLIAVRTLTSDGININATLLFSVARYLEVMQTYLAGLEDRLEKGEEIKHIRSVGSFFISRIDANVDQALSQLEKQANADYKHLRGKVAIANAKVAYQTWKEVLKTERFQKLQKFGAVMQYPLWASTGTKDPTYPDTLYIDTLEANGTVNTVPPQTLKAFLDHGCVSFQIESDLEGARKTFTDLQALGIDLAQVTSLLEEDGVLKFKQAYLSLLETIETKRHKTLKGLGHLTVPIQQAVCKAAEDVMVSRLFEHDPTLWTEDRAQFDEIRNRLGWLDLPSQQLSLISDLESFRNLCLQAGFTDVFVLGMGGSSLAPEVFSLTFAKEVPAGQGLRLQIIDTTNPDEIAWRKSSVDLCKTVFIVASKSGTTSETNAAFHYFWQQLVDLGVEHPGDHFIAITDPGTVLEALASDRKFMRTFQAPANVGGRYSAFTTFGLVPGALMGIDLKKMLARATETELDCCRDVPYSQNPGLVLGLSLAEASKVGVNKLIFISDEICKPFGPWLEQLVAESSGKEGKGLLPVESEPQLNPEDYTKDRIFIDMRVDLEVGERLSALSEAGHPVIQLHLADVYDLAKQFYLWEYATAILCADIGVNAFDQPNVQESKTNTKAVIKAFEETGTLNEGDPIWQDEQGSIYGKVTVDLNGAKDLTQAVKAFLGSLGEGGFITINAYLERTPAMEAQLAVLRKKLLLTYHCPVTLGFGPRFQHSTGQFHKGGFPGGHFLVLTKDPNQDLPIPEEGMSFGILQRAQALGDMESLERNGRKVIRVHLKSAVPESLA
jgi:transaldolase/glucose-6-phosphate isomerase